MIRAHTLLSKSRPGYQAWRDLRQFKPFRRIGVMVWGLCHIYFVGLCSFLPRGREIATPDGDYVREGDFRLSPYDVISRWLELVSKSPPDAGVNYDNSPSTLAGVINPL